MSDDDVKKRSYLGRFFVGVEGIWKLHFVELCHLADI